MAFELRDYQAQLIQQLKQAYAQGAARVMLQLPTGGGKTVIFTEIAARHVAKGGRVWVIAHREELIKQAAKAFRRVGLSPGIIKSGYTPSPFKPVQVCSITTLGKRLETIQQYPKPTLIITDEAHHATANTYRQVYASFPGAYFLGVTATPVRLSGEGFSDLFDKLILGPSVQSMIANGYLVKPSCYIHKGKLELKGIRKNRGDYNIKQLAQAVNKQQILGDLVKNYQRICPAGTKLVAFGVNVAHSKAIALSYSNAGYSAAHIDGSTPPGLRDKILSQFERGEIQILSNCDIVTEGFDIPEIGAVQLCRPTLSLALYLQMVGRALRISPGKETAYVLDHAEAIKTHGLPEQDRVWSLEGAKKSKAGKQVVKAVKNGQVIGIYETGPGGGLDLPTEIDGVTLEVVGEDEAQELNKVAERASYARQLVGTAQRKGFKKHWVYYNFVRRYPEPTLTDLKTIGAMLGYKPYWAIKRHEELQQNRQQQPA